MRHNSLLPLSLSFENRAAENIKRCYGYLLLIQNQLNWPIQCFITEPSTVHTNDVFTVLAETNTKQIQSPFDLFKMQ